MTTEAQTGTVEVAVIEPVPASLTVFVPLEEELLALEEFNKTIQWDYKDKKDNEAARSWVRKVQVLKNKTDTARKDQNKRTNEKGHALVARLESIIAVHKKPLDAEKNRIGKINSMLLQMDNIVNYVSEHNTSEEIKASMKQLDVFEINEKFQELESDARLKQGEGLVTLVGFLEISQKREEDAAELDRLRKAEAARLKEVEIKRVETIQTRINNIGKLVDGFTADSSIDDAKDCQRRVLETLVDDSYEELISQAKETKLMALGKIARVIKQIESPPVEIPTPSAKKEEKVITCVGVDCAKGEVETVVVAEKNVGTGHVKVTYMGTPGEMPGDVKNAMLLDKPATPSSVGYKPDPRIVDILDALVGFGIMGSKAGRLVTALMNNKIPHMQVIK